MTLFRFNPGVTVQWSAPLVVSAIAALIGGGVVVVELAPVIGTLFSPSPGSDESTSMARAGERHGALVKTSTDRFSGRSLFTMPAPPPRPAPPPPPPAPPAPPAPPPPPPSAPAEYSGTLPTGMLGDLVYFGGTLTIRVGEEKNGIKVIGVEPPSNVLIEHARGTYSVAIWTPVDWSKLSANAPSRTSPIIKAVVVEPAVEIEETSQPTIAAPELDPAPEPAPPLAAPVAPIVPIVPIAPIAPIAPPESANDERDVPDPDAPNAERVDERPALVVPSSQPQPRLGESPTLNPTTTIPPPLSQAQVALLTHAQAQAALARVSRARQTPGLDQPTQNRLRDEAARLRARLSEGGQ